MIEWEDLVLTTAERFGGNLPHHDTNRAIASVYTKAPTAVLKAIERVATDYDAGTVRSPWGILKSRVQQITVDQRQTTVGNDLERRTARAEQWLKNAGLMYDRWDETHDELFGDRGILHPERNNTNTADRIHTLWNELRPLGITTEQAELERAQHWKDHQDAIANIPKHPTPNNLATIAGNP